MVLVASITVVMIVGVAAAADAAEEVVVVVEEVVGAVEVEVGVKDPRRNQHWRLRYGTLGAFLLLGCHAGILLILSFPFILFSRRCL